MDSRNSDQEKKTIKKKETNLIEAAVFPNKENEKEKTDFCNFS